MNIDAVAIIKCKNKVLFVESNSYSNSVYGLPYFHINSNFDAKSEIIKRVKKLYNMDIEIINKVFSNLNQVWYEAITGYEIQLSNVKWSTLKTAKHYTFKENLSDIIIDYIWDNEDKSNIKLQFGLRNNKIIHISDIAENERGISCDCVCPLCKTVLRAKLGYGKRQAHFAHSELVNCDDYAAQQTAIHLLAKDILANRKEIVLPSFEIDESNGEYDDIRLSYEAEDGIRANYVYSKPIRIKFDKIVLEHKLGNIIPDIIIETKNKKLIIEIAVSHFVDDIKKEKIKDLNISALEIDISGYANQAYNRNLLERLIIDSIENKKWIFNTKYKRALAKLRKRNKKIVEDDLKRKKQEKILENKCILIKEKSKKVLINALKPESYVRIIDNQRNDDKALDFIKQTKFFGVKREIPFFVDIPILGEIAFKCDRRIWQSAIFDKFIFNRKQPKEYSPTAILDNVWKWTKYIQNSFKINWMLGRNNTIKYDNLPLTLNFAYDSVKEYVNYLAYIGFILSECNISYGNYYEVIPFTVVPPKKENSKKLIKSINDLSNNMINVNSELKNLLNKQNGLFHEPTYDYNIDKMPNYIENKRLEDEVNYRAGYQQIRETFNKNAKENIMDSYKYRWLYCVKCGKIKREDEMISYQYNQGVCRECEIKEHKLKNS